MKHKISGLTELEKQDVKTRYAEWSKSENLDWVVIEYEDALKNAGDIIKNKITKFDFLKTFDEKIWVLEKLKDHETHSSDYINQRIGEFPILDFNDETRQRILLEEIEGGGVQNRGFRSDFIEL